MPSDTALRGYPEYKESGSDLIGKVPVTWRILPLRRVAAICNGADHKPFEVEDGGFPVYGSGGEFSRCSRYLWDQPSLLLGRKGTIDRPLLAQQPFWSVDTMYYTRLAAGHSAKFLHYVAQECFPFDLFTYGTALPSMTQRDYYTFPVPAPSAVEEVQIASFLDRETAKIDELIAKQERLIELLTEKRQAVISHAVTKGLDPTVPMKASGIEWLGDIPGHWWLTTVRRFASAVDTGRTPSNEAPSSELDEGLNWFTPGDFTEFPWMDTATKKIRAGAELSVEVKLFPPGGVLVVCIGATIGKVGISQKPFSANQQINVIVPTAAVSAEFLAYSLCVKADLMRFLSNAATIGILNQERTKEICVAVPPVEEQDAILRFLRNETGKIDALIGKANQSIELMKERRSALISAAVTGKIDVREVA